MQINSLGGVQAYNLNLPNQARTLKNIPPPPSFGAITDTEGIILTYTEPTRSDEEIINDVIALAKKHAQQYPDPYKYPPASEKLEMDKLFGEYMSSVSPDRKAIFAKGADSAQTEMKNRISKPIIDMSLFEFVYFRKNSVKASLWFDSQNKKVDVGTIQFYENGEPIGEYNGFHGFWAGTYTKAEVARRGELANIYSQAWEAAKNSSTAATANSNSFDFAAHNVSNQQNQTAQNTPVQQAASRYEQMQYVEHKK